MPINKTFLHKQDITEIIYVWSVRLWIHDILNNIDPKLNLKKFLNQFHLTETVMYLDKLMWCISFSKKQNLDFRNLQCVYIGDGEKKLLKSLYFAQNNLYKKNNLEINNFIDEIYLADFNRSIKEIAKIYAKNGYFFN